MADNSWMDDAPPASGGIPGAPTWLNDTPFGDTPPPPMVDTSHDAMPAHWNDISSLAHGLGLGLAEPSAAALLAVNRARKALQAGQNWDYVRGNFPDWVSQYNDRMTKEHAQFHKIAPLADTIEETAGTVAPTVLGTGAMTTGLRAGAEAIGLPGLGRFLAGTAGRAGGAADSVVAPASVGFRGASQGAGAGVLQSQMDPEKPIGEQAAAGAALGPLAELFGAGAKPLRNEVFGMSRGQVPVARAQIAADYDKLATRAAAEGHISHSLVQDSATGQVSPKLLDVFLPRGASKLRAEFADIQARERGLARIEQQAAAHKGITGKLINKLGVGAAAGVGAGAGAGLIDPALEILKDPSSWPLILGAIGAAGLARGGRSVLVHNPVYRNMLMRAQASGMTPAEWLGVGNPLTAVGNRLMEYEAPKLEAQNGQ